MLDFTRNDRQPQFRDSAGAQTWFRVSAPKVQEPTRTVHNKILPVENVPVESVKLQILRLAFSRTTWNTTVRLCSVKTPPRLQRNDRDGSSDELGIWT